MKKYFALIFVLLMMTTFYTSTHVSADRSYSIDQVTINAEIDEEGTMHVFERYTYTFDGSFQGVTRSIGSDVRNFKAYLIDGQSEQYSELPQGAEPLTVEKADQTFRIFTESKDETKFLLYQYEVKGSVDKYLDTADITYDFFDDSNEVDLSNLTITFFTPTKVISDQTHAFLHANSGELTTTRSNIQYTNELLKAGEHTRVRLIFPAEELSSMKLTKDQEMYDKILTAEKEYIEKLEKLNQEMDGLRPNIWVLLTLLMVTVVIIAIIHPNRYRGNKHIDDLLQLLEQTDPLFISYLNMNGGVHDHSIIAALFSLRRRGIVTFAEVPSLIHEHVHTFRLTWVDERTEVDLADGYLREWLFTEKDENGRYFLLEAIIDNPDESDSVREKKANELRQHFDKWEGLVNSREDYRGLRKPFRGYSLLTIIFSILSFGLFYYLTTVQPISPTEQMVLPIIGGVLAFISVIFSRNKWIFPFYYLFLIIASSISFIVGSTVVLAILFFVLTLVILLFVPASYWKEDIKKIKFAMKRAYNLMATDRYPIGSDVDEIEKQLEYAIILGTGESFAELCNREERFENLNVENSLLKNPITVTDTFSTNNIILYSTIHIGATETFSGSTTSSTSSTGGGGAGAF